MFDKFNLGKSDTTIVHFPGMTALGERTSRRRVFSPSVIAKSLFAFACFCATTVASASVSLSESPAPMEMSAAPATNAPYFSVFQTTLHKITLRYQLTGNYSFGYVKAFSLKELSAKNGPVNATPTATIYLGNLNGYATFDFKDWESGSYGFYLYDGGSAPRNIVAYTNKTIEAKTGIDKASCYNDQFTSECWLKKGQTGELIIKDSQNEEWYSKSVGEGTTKCNFGVSDYLPGQYKLELWVGGNLTDTKTFRVYPRVYVDVPEDDNLLYFYGVLNPYAKTKIEFYHKTNGIADKKCTHTYYVPEGDYFGDEVMWVATWPAGDYYARVYEGTTCVLTKSFTINHVENDAILELTNDTQNHIMNYRCVLPDGKSDGSVSIVKKADLIANNYNFYKINEVPIDCSLGDNGSIESFDYNYLNSGEYLVCLFGDNRQSPYKIASFNYSGYETTPSVSMSVIDNNMFELAYDVTNGVEDAEIRIVRVAGRISDNLDVDEETLMQSEAAYKHIIRGTDLRHNSMSIGITRYWDEGVYCAILIENGKFVCKSLFRPYGSSAVAPYGLPLQNNINDESEIASVENGNQVKYFVESGANKVVFRLSSLNLSAKQNVQKDYVIKNFSTSYLNTMTITLDDTCPKGTYSLQMYVDGAKKGRSVTLQKY